ncbi:hypothetical protein [Listeria ilorinensis]|uniref:hypothetical protein n=1 Tax=Listeria ilorinensis TaxID=2867439 RepID=UPI001EF68249|nr:hypothetical protein [Listeria ilorinensis]
MKIEFEGTIEAIKKEMRDFLGVKSELAVEPPKKQKTEEATTEEQPKKAPAKKETAKTAAEAKAAILKKEIDKRIEDLDADGRMDDVNDLFQKQYCQPLREISPDLYPEVIERLEAIKSYVRTEPVADEAEKVTPTITLSDLTRRVKSANNNAKVRKLLNKFGAIKPETERPNINYLKEQDYALFLAELEA